MSSEFFVCWGMLLVAMIVPSLVTWSYVGGVYADTITQWIGAASGWSVGVSAWGVWQHAAIVRRLREEGATDV